MQAVFLEAVNYLQDDVIKKLDIFMHPSGGFIFFSLLMYSELKFLIAQVIPESHGYRICSEGKYTGNFWKTFFSQKILQYTTIV